MRLLRHARTLWLAIASPPTSNALSGAKHAHSVTESVKNWRVMARGMETLSTLSDAELVARLPLLVQAERHAMADVIEHLVEVERRRLYLAHATSSLYRYCVERLGYSED